MKKLLAPILTIAIVAALAAVLYVRGNVERSSPSVAVSSKTESDPTVRWSVTPANGGDGAVYAYDVNTKQTSGPLASFEGAGLVRFNQSSDLCDPVYVTTPIALSCQYDDRGVLALTAYDGDGGPQLLAKTIDPRALGITPGAVEGYLVPVAVADDKSVIYLGRRVETESWVAGLWKLDVATGEVSEISYVRENHLYQYDINVATKQLLGVTFVPPEGLGEDVSGPSEMHLVDLTTGEGRMLEAMAKDYLENPMLSEDGSRYAFREAGPTLGAGRTVVLRMSTGRVGAGWEIDGIMKDWFGDTVVFDRAGNLFLYDLKTKTETQITHETDATVEYVGVAR